MIDYLDKNKSIKNQIIVNEFSVNRDTARDDLNILIKTKKIIKKGAGNNVWYELRNKE
ncbi:MAG: DeoR family transcriptional regulator [DPANN group archaeon]|nr:DeoR family transcriptional regulator [DPANN group archaeon]